MMHLVEDCGVNEGTVQTGQTYKAWTSDMLLLFAHKLPYLLIQQYNLEYINTIFYLINFLESNWLINTLLPPALHNTFLLPGTSERRPVK